MISSSSLASYGPRSTYEQLDDIEGASWISASTLGVHFESQIRVSWTYEEAVYE